MLKFSFIIMALIFFLAFVFGKFFVFGKKHPMFVDKYVAGLTFSMVFYCLLAGALILYGSIVDKIVMLFIFLSPFIIGKITTYKTLNFYTGVQFAVILFSIGYVWLRF